MNSVVEVTDCEETSVSVAIEEFSPHDWTESVYRPDILESQATLLKKPGYNPFSSKGEERKQNDSPSLMEYVRQAAALAAGEDTSGMFNPMSWLDLELEDTHSLLILFLIPHGTHCPTEKKGNE